MDLLSQHEAFLRAIFDAPDDDTPRLVYADFLQENGEEDRAEFIRVQCELAAIWQSGSPDRVWELETRRDELLWRLEPERAYQQPWQRKQVDHARGFRLAGGTLMVTPGALADPTAARWQIVRHEPELFGARRLTVGPGLSLRPEHIESLFEQPAPRRVTEWLLSGYILVSESGPGDFALTDLAQEPVITSAGVEALTLHSGARRLTVLDLRNNGLDNDAARALVASPYLDNLTRLELYEGNQFQEKVWQQVIERFGEDVVG